MLSRSAQFAGVGDSPGKIVAGCRICIVPFDSQAEQDQGDYLLEDRDRGLWNQAEIEEGVKLAESALRRAPEPYSAPRWRNVAS
jgi:hypothetical protein